MSMKSEVSEKLPRFLTIPPILVTDGSKTSVHCKEEALQAEYVSQSSREVATNLLAQLETGTTRTFLRPLKDEAQQPYSQLLHDILLEFFQ